MDDLDSIVEANEQLFSESVVFNMRSNEVLINHRSALQRCPFALDILLDLLNGLAFNHCFIRPALVGKILISLPISAS